MGGQEGDSLSLFISGRRSNPGKPFLLFFRVPSISLFSFSFFFVRIGIVFVWHHVCFHNRVALAPGILCLVYMYMHTECCCRCCCCSVLLYRCCCCSCFCYRLLLLRLAAGVCHAVPDGNFCCWFIESDPSVFFLFIQTRYIFNVPLGSNVAFTASICLHPR